MRCDRRSRRRGPRSRRSGRPLPSVRAGRRHRALAALDGDDASASSTSAVTGRGLRDEPQLGLGAAQFRDGERLVLLLPSFEEGSERVRAQLRPGRLGQSGGEALVVPPRSLANRIAQPGVARDDDLVHSHGLILPRYVHHPWGPAARSIQGAPQDERVHDSGDAHRSTAGETPATTCRAIPTVDHAPQTS